MTASPTVLPDRKFLNAMAVRHSRQDDLDPSIKNLPARKAVFAGWYHSVTREVLFELYTSGINWDIYKDQLISKYGEPQVLIDGADLYKRDRPPRDRHPETDWAAYFQKDPFYKVDLIKKHRDRIILFW